MVQAMELYQATQLLQDKLGEAYDLSLAPQLLKYLGYMPLAISHAAAFINCRPRMSVARYLEEFQRDDRRLSILMDKFGDQRRDESASDSIIKTWQMTFEKIREEHSSASELLLFMSFLNPHGIPGLVLEGYMRHCKRRRSLLDDDMAVLSQYSLVTKADDEDLFEIHMWVKQCSTVWLSTFEDVQKWNGIFLQVIESVYPMGRFEDIAVCQMLEPHIDGLLADEAIDMAHARADTLADLLLKAACYRYSKGRNAEAESLARRCLRLKESVHQDRLPVVDLLAYILNNRGAFVESEQVCRQSYNPSVTSFYSLSVQRSLGFSLIEQNKLVEAGQILRSAHGTCARQFGPEHALTLHCMGDLATTLAELGSVDAALDLARCALDTSERTNTRNHPQTINFKNHLASILHNSGRHIEAEQEYRSALQSAEKTMGSEHPQTLHIRAGLASCLGEQGAYDEAKRMLLQCLDVYQGTQGPDAYDTLQTTGRLGHNAYIQGDFSDAAVWNERTYNGFLRTHGPDHEFTMSSLRGLRASRSRQLDMGERYQQGSQRRKPSTEDRRRQQSQRPPSSTREGRQPESQRLRPSTGERRRQDSRRPQPDTTEGHQQESQRPKHITEELRQQDSHSTRERHRTDSRRWQSDTRERRQQESRRIQPGSEELYWQSFQRLRLSDAEHRQQQSRRPPPGTGVYYLDQSQWQPGTGEYREQQSQWLWPDTGEHYRRRYRRP